MAVFSAIGAAITAISGWTIGLGSLGTFAAGNFLLRAAVSLGVSALSRAFAGDDAGERFSIQGSVRTGGTVPRSFVVGPAITAGSLAWHSEWGEVDDTPNAFYTQVIALSDLPVSGFRRWFINGQAVTLAAEAGEYGFAAEQYTRDGVEHAWIKFHDGNQSAADPFLSGTVSAGAPREYSSSRIGTGVAYAIVTFRVNQEFFPGFPASKFVLDGVKFYDISRDETVGGVGSHRWDDASTWGGDGDALPAVQAYNLARGLYYGRSFLGGGASASGDVALEGDLSALSLKIVGGGGGTDGAGGDTSVVLKDGGTVVQTWIAAGGLATSSARYTDEASAAGGVSGLSPRGNGAAGVVEIFEGGSEGLGLIQEGIAGGTAGEFIEITALDISGLAAPSLEVVVGVGGAGASAGFVEYNADVAAAAVEQKWFYGLQGLTPARLPAAHWISQVEKCRSTIAGEGGDEPLYRSAGEITVDSEIGAAFDVILTACAGRMSEVGGVFKIYVGAPDEPVASFTDEDIVSLAPQTFTPFFGLSNTVNGVIATYPSPDEGYVMRSTPPLYNPEYEVQDGNRRLPVSVALDFVPFPAQAQRLLAGELAAARRARRHTFTLPARYRKLEPGDVTSWESARNGYEGKWFRVDGVIDLPNCDLIVDLTEVDPTDHGNWQHSTDYKPQTGGIVLPVLPVSQLIAGWSVSPVTIPNDAGTAELPAILVRWDGSKSDVIGVRVQVRRAGTSDLIFDGRIEDYLSGRGIISQALLGATEYEVRGKYIPGTQRQTEFSAWLAVTTDDVGLGTDAFWDELAGRAQSAFDQANEATDLIMDTLAGFNLETRVTQVLEDARVEGVIEETEERIGVELGDANAEIVTIKAAAVTDRAAVATLENTLTTSIGNVSGEVSTVATSLSTLDGQFSAYQTYVAGQFADRAAYVNTNYYTKVAADLAIAGAVSVVSTEVDGVSTTLTEVSGSVDGLSAIKSVKIDNDGLVRGYMLNSQQVAGGGSATDMIFDVDDFYVGTSNSSGDFAAPFIVSGGTVYIDKTRIRSADIDTLKIAGNSVTSSDFTVGGSKTGNGSLQLAAFGDVRFPGNTSGDLFVAITFEQGYAAEPTQWGYQIEGGFGFTPELFRGRTGMVATVDNPAVTFFKMGLTNTSSTARFYRVDAYWYGQNANISMPSCTLSLLTRFR